MKKILLLTVLLFGMLQVTTVSAQVQTPDKPGNKTAEAKKDTLLPYQKHPALPAFKILEMDSTTTFNTYDIKTGKPILLMFFGPDCGHCKHQMEKMIAGMDSLKQLQIYMVSFANPTPIKNFYEEYHLANYPNIKVVGKDAEFFFSSWFGARSVPYMAVYDKHKKFVKKFESSATVEELYQASKK